MSDKSQSSKKNKLNRTDKIIDLALWIAFFAVCIGIGVSHVKEAITEKNKKKQETEIRKQRSDDFANYIISDTKDWVLANLNDNNINVASQKYNTDSVLFNHQMDTLIMDSTKYADAIFRDARIITYLDQEKNKLVPLSAAMDYVDSQKMYRQVVKYKEYHSLEYDGFDGFYTLIEREPVDTIVEYNQTPARILKINKKHLRDVSLDLATRRVAKTR